MCFWCYQSQQKRSFIATLSACVVALILSLLRKIFGVSLSCWLFSCLQLLLEDPMAFPGQMEYVIPPAFFWVCSRFCSQLDVSRIPPWEVFRRHPNQMSETTSKCIGCILASFRCLRALSCP